MSNDAIVFDIADQNDCDYQYVSGPKAWETVQEDMINRKVFFNRSENQY